MAEKIHSLPATPVLHGGNGPTLKATTVLAMLTWLGIRASYSRPRVSDDNPFSEAHFKTLKYRPTFPERFGSIEDARAHCQEFFQWYNSTHRHSGIGYMTPHTVHHGEAVALNLQRADTLNAAFIAHPERFKGIAPKPPSLPTAAWINPPKKETENPLIRHPVCSLN